MNAEAIRRPSDDKFIENERQNPLVSVCLPILAVFLHLRVFFHAVACLSTTFTDKLPIQDSLVNLTLIDRYFALPTHSISYAAMHSKQSRSQDVTLPVISQDITDLFYCYFVHSACQHSSNSFNSLIRCFIILLAILKTMVM
jgi:hypothetical protein